MFYTNVIEPYIRMTEQNPDQTVAKIDGQVYSYAQLAQRIAPIMNELDALSIPRAGIVMKQDLTAFAALLACLFNGIVAVPLPESLTESQREAVAHELELPQVLTVERMHYYFRMTFEDALCRIDNGLYRIDDPQLMSIVCHFDDHGKLASTQDLHAGEFKRQKHFSLAPIFQQLIPDSPTLCSIF